MVAKRILQDIKTFNWVILFILSALSGIFMTAQFTLGVILGGLIIIANFSLLHNTMSKAFSDQGAMRGKKWRWLQNFILGLPLWA